jgi:1,2-phenylacetyl-CoA epoxidase PaaB subunit
VAFVPFQFEVFSELTLRVRQHSPFQHTLSLSNANGSYFYFPSREQIARGGYEVWVFKSMNVFALADDADDAAVSDNLRLLDALAEEKTQTG